MSHDRTAHSTFTLERIYPVPPARVFAAFADPQTKARWFAGPQDWEHGQHEMDFRVGGEEISISGPPGGPRHLYRARYHYIEPDSVVLFSSEIFLDDRLLSVSVTTVELVHVAAGTSLSLTEQTTFLGTDEDIADRKRGTADLLDALATELRSATA